MFSDIYKGAYFFAQGLKLACSRQYRGFLLSILLTTLIVFIVLLLFVAIPVVEAIGFQAEQKLPSWLQWLWYPAEVILYLVSIFLSGALSNIISTTLNSFRLAKLSLLVGTSQPPSGSLQNEEIGDKSTSLISSAKREGSRLSYVLPRIFLVGILSLVPVGNFILVPLSLIISARSIAAQYLDVPSENANQTFANTLALIKDNKLTSLAVSYTHLTLPTKRIV